MRRETQALADAPLTWLLSVGAPENSHRVARSLAAATHELATALPETTSAGLIVDTLVQTAHAYSTGPAQYPLGVTLARELEPLPLPPSTQRWQRVLYQPTSEDVERLGVAALYEFTYLAHGFFTAVPGAHAIPVVAGRVQTATE